jgi:hypothetical protein
MIFVIWHVFWQISVVNLQNVEKKNCHCFSFIIKFKNRNTFYTASRRIALNVGKICINKLEFTDSIICAHKRDPILMKLLSTKRLEHSRCRQKVSEVDTERLGLKFSTSNNIINIWFIFIVCFISLFMFYLFQSLQVLNEDDNV